jgi:hypothetical protein
METIVPLRDACAWAIDLQICVFPQEGLFTAPETEALMREALAMGADVVSGVPYVDTDARAHVELVFALAREFDRDVDFHLATQLGEVVVSGKRVMLRDVIAREYGLNSRQALVVGGLLEQAELRMKDLEEALPRRESTDAPARSAGPHKARGGEEHRRGQSGPLQVEDQGLMNYRDRIATRIATRSRHRLRQACDIP